MYVSSGIANNTKPLRDQIVWPPKPNEKRHTTLKDVTLSGSSIAEAEAELRACSPPAKLFSNLPFRSENSASFLVFV